MRCPDCQKFVGMDADSEPEESGDLNVDPENNSVDVSVRITNNCADCGTELKEAEIALEFAVDGLSAHDGDGHELEVECEYDRTERSEGKGRGRRTFYGVHATATVTCKCGWEATAEASEDVQASGMEECC